MQALELVGTSLENGVSRHFSAISIALISCFRDPSEKVRLAAISGLYNLLNKYSEEGLKVFLDAFQGVAVAVGDESSSVRQAATFLNHSLKTVLN